MCAPFVGRAYGDAALVDELTTVIATERTLHAASASKFRFLRQNEIDTDDDLRAGIRALETMLARARATLACSVGY